MKRAKGKSRTIRDEIVAYELQIAGDREDAERAADEWGVRIRVFTEDAWRNEVFAVCPVGDMKEILAWHGNSVLRLRAGGRPRPGELMRISQPPEDVDTDFTVEKK
jgi:hypothetical protein